VSWAPELTLAELADGGLFTDGDWVESKDQDSAGSIRLTQLADVGVGEFRNRSDRWMRRDQAASLGCTFLHPNDILIARMPDPIGRACLAPMTIGAAVTAVDVAILRVALPDVDPRYVMWAVNSPRFHASVVGLQSGTTRKRISRKNLATLTIPVPHLDEQRRIVDLLEDHLSRLDAADAYLAAGRRRLDLLQQTALASCRDGETHLLADIAAIQGGIQKQQKRVPKRNHYPFLRVANVTAKGLDLADVHSVELFEGELDRLRLQLGDLLVVEGNGSASQIGRAALWDGSIADCVHQNHLIRVRPLTGLLPTYLEAVWNSPQNRSILTDVSSSSSGLHTLSVSKLKALAIPVPTVERQRELVVKVDKAREARARLASAIGEACARKSALRRSLLAAAFSGRLTAAESQATSADMVEELAGV
jgi:type I restriction enzyme, S subunit